MTVETKQEAMDLFEATRAEWLAETRSIALRIGSVPITVNDVRKAAPPLPDGVDPRVYGAIFNTSDWEFVGYVKSDRRVSHGRPVALYRKVA